MSLPAHNPIDAEWFARGIPIDYLGSKKLECRACGKTTVQEGFHVVVGSAIGFGAPVFVKPFLKRSSTKGKIGGTRGNISQCTMCDSLWPMDLDGSAVLMTFGFDADGIVHPAVNYKARNQAAANEEKTPKGSSASKPQPSVRKTRD